MLVLFLLNARLEPFHSAPLVTELRSEGASIVTSPIPPDPSAPDFLNDIARSPWDLLVVEDDSPSEAMAVRLCHALRHHDVGAPMLLVSPDCGSSRKTAAYDAGADDYLCVPFDPAEASARIRALCRRDARASRPLVVDDLRLNPISRLVSRAGHPIMLSTTEYNLLECLMRSAGRTVLRAEIMNRIWPDDDRGNDNVLDVYISYLRAKIDRGSARPLLRTVRGFGYKIAPADAPPLVESIHNATGDLRETRAAPN